VSLFTSTGLHNLIIPIEAQSLVRKYHKAVAGCRDLREAFVGLDESVTDEQRKKWEKDEKMAMKHRGDKLEVYGVQMDKGEFENIYHYTWRQNFKTLSSPVAG
jgi:hypothetical protein